MSEMVTIPREEYERLLEAAEHLSDIAAYDRAMANPGELIPEVFVERILNGESPLRVYRDLRGLSQSALSRKSGVNRTQISDIEAKRSTGSVATLKKLAAALDLGLDDITL